MSTSKMKRTWEGPDDAAVPLSNTGSNHFDDNSHGPDVDGVFDLTDAELCYFSVVNRIPNAHHAVRGAFVSQIEIQSHDKVDLVDSLEMMRRSSKYRFLNCSFAGVESDFVMEFEKYLSVLAIWANTQPRKQMQLLYKFKEFLLSCPKLCVLHSELMDFRCRPEPSGTGDGGKAKAATAKELVISEADIQCLVALGYLRRRRDTNASDIFWFSHPQLGPLINRVIEARKSILSMLRQRQYKEINVSELCSRAGQGPEQLQSQSLASSSSSSSSPSSSTSAGTADDAAQESSKQAKKKTKSSAAGEAVASRGSGDFAESSSGNNGAGAGSGTACMKSLQCTLVQGIEFHIQELVGSGLVARVPSPRGDVLRLK